MVIIEACRVQEGKIVMCTCRRTVYDRDRIADMGGHRQCAGEGAAGRST